MVQPRLERQRQRQLVVLLEQLNLGLSRFFDGDHERDGCTRRDVLYGADRRCDQQPDRGAHRHEPDDTSGDYVG